MWDFSLLSVFRAMFKTWPYLLVRFVAYSALALFYIFSTGAGTLIGYYLFGFLGESNHEEFTLGSGGFGLTVAIIVSYALREYILYLVKAGHIAVLTKLYDKQPLPDGRGQVDYGVEIVKTHFVESSALFVLDQLVKGVLKAMAEMLNKISRWLPIPGADILAGIFSRILTMSLTFVDEIILAYHFRSGSDNAWESSKVALILYAQNYNKMLINAVWLWLMLWLLTIGVFIFFLFVVAVPVALVFENTPYESIGGVMFGFSIVFAYIVKKVLFEPIAIFALMQVYFKAIEGQQPDPVWDERLSQASDKFQELKDKALEFIKPKPEASEMQY